MGTPRARAREGGEFVSHETEDALHRAVADFLMLALDPSVVWTTFPAGGGGRSRGAQLKAKGMMPGWPDIQFIHPATGRLYCVELKRKGGVLNDDQKRTIPALINTHVPVSVCRSIEQVEQFLRAFDFPLRATARAA